jgi:AcrR family transcriptional regulator
VTEETRKYVSPKRQAQAAATREAILKAFADQVSEGDDLSPSDAAAQVGVSVRTVHTHFPNRESQLAARGEWFDTQIFPGGFVPAQGPEDLPRYFRDIHSMALASPLATALASKRMKWPEVRQRRRLARLDAIRKAVKDIGAPRRATEDATALLLSLSGIDASWPLHELYGLPLDRIPDVIAHNVQLIVDNLKLQAKERSRAATARDQ